MPINVQLPSDLLLEIFLKNTQMMEDDLPRKRSTPNSLLTARRTSQVCRLWRELILGCPQLWGRVIDLNDLLKKGSASEIWRKLVIERSGTSDLWIYGTIVHENAGASFYSILDAHWARVRSFNVTLDIDVDSFRFMKVIQRPAEQLDSFRLRKLEDFGYRYDLFSDTVIRINGQEPVLFSNHAPFLRVFSSNLGFRPAAPWVSQLRSLSLSSTQFSVLDLLALIPEMSLLETLTLNSAFCSPQQVPTVSTKTSTLPHLKQFVISGTLGSCAAIFDRLHLPSECSLNLLFLPHFLLPQDDILLLEAPISLYESISHCAAQFSSDNAKKSLLFISNNEILLSNEDPSLLHNLHLEQYDSEALPDHDIFSAMLSCVLNSLLANGPIFGQDKILRLTLPRNAIYLGKDAELQHFLHSLSNTNKIETDLETLETLLRIRTDATLLLPSLQELALLGIECCSTDLSEESPIPMFLKWRREVGVPIGVLDLSSYIFKDVNLESVGGMVGMKIRWRRLETGRVREYVCGSRDSGELYL